MEIEYLRQFSLLARECHFQTAADMLYINQSTLSKHIASLEKELGNRLFHRSTRQVELTDFGKAFLPYAEKIIGVMEDCDIQLLQQHRHHQPPLHVGLSPFVSVKYLMEGKKQCLPACPDLAGMIFTETDSAHLREGLRSGRFQMVMDGTGSQWEEEDFAALPYMQDHLCAVLPQSHALARAETVSLSDFSGTDTLGYIHLFTETIISPLLPEPILIADTVPQVLMAVRDGKGFSLLPYQRVKNHLPEGVCTVRLSPSPVLHFVVYTLRKAAKTDAQAVLMDYFAHLANDLV